MSPGVRIGLVQHLAGIGVHNEIRVGRGARGITRQDDDRSSKTAYAETKPMTGSDTVTQHGIPPSSSPLALLSLSAGTPCRAEVNGLDEPIRAVF